MFCLPRKNQPGQSIHASRLPLRLLGPCLLTLLLASCGWADPQPASMPLDEEAAQVLLIGIEGQGQPSPESLDLVGRLMPGGIILFGSNLPARAVDTGRLTAALQDAVVKGKTGSALKPIPLFIAIDHEGGLVFRFKSQDISHLPAAASVGEKGPAYARILGECSGAELRSLGISLNLAPVVELLNAQNQAFLVSRSYGSTASVVDAAAGAFIDGLQSTSVAAVAKHFPGNAAADPHKVLPSLDISRQEYEAEYRPRFASAIRHKVAAVMLSHVQCDALDSQLPASLSPRVVLGELRKELGFQGLAITDDLDMKALSLRLGPEAAALAALKAGDDLLMITDMHQAYLVKDAIVKAVQSGQLPRNRLDEAVGRVLRLKKNLDLGRELDTAAREARIAAYPTLVAEDAMRIKAFERESEH